jgi:hypothetical protein
LQGKRFIILYFLQKYPVLAVVLPQQQVNYKPANRDKRDHHQPRPGGRRIPALGEDDE